MPLRICDRIKYHKCPATLTTLCTIIISAGIRLYVVSTLKGKKTYLFYIDFTAIFNDFNFSCMAGSFLAHNNSNKMSHSKISFFYCTGIFNIKSFHFSFIFDQNLFM